MAAIMATRKSTLTGSGSHERLGLGDFVVKVKVENPYLKQYGKTVRGE